MPAAGLATAVIEMFETDPECASPLEPPVMPTIQFVVPYATPLTKAAPNSAKRKRRLRDDF